MFQKILKIFGFKKALNADQILRYPQPKQYSRDQHPIRVSHLDPDAVKVVQRIQQMGCRAYIVGGSIRDLLLGRKPKDYDVVTDAHPQELRRMFANSRIIGDVRGIGLMIGVEFVLDRATKKPASALVAALEQHAFRKGLLLLSCGQSTIRVAPPLVLDSYDVDRGLEIFEAALREVEALHEGLGSLEERPHPVLE